MNKKITIKRMFLLALAGWGILTLLFVADLYQVGASHAQVVAVTDLRYRSYLLAGELRQTSDELTSLARTYVVTAEAKYEQEYQKVIDVRSGKLPRQDGRTAALIDLMKESGFSNVEFAKLNEAQKNSDALVRTEVAAMNAVKGRFDVVRAGICVWTRLISRLRATLCMTTITTRIRRK